MTPETIVAAARATLDTPFSHQGREAGTALKTDWRLQITGAGLGPRPANSIRSQNFLRSGESLDAAALVWSKAPVIVGAHDTGPLIRSRNGLS